MQQFDFALDLRTLEVFVSQLPVIFTAAAGALALVLLTQLVLKTVVLLAKVCAFAGLIAFIFACALQYAPQVLSSEAVWKLQLAVTHAASAIEQQAASKAWQYAFSRRQAAEPPSEVRTPVKHHAERRAPNNSRKNGR